MGFPPVCAAQGHGGKRLVSGPRPCAGPANMRRGTAQKRGGDYALAGALCSRGHGTRGPRRCRTRGEAAHFVDCGELSAGQV